MLEAWDCVQRNSKSVQTEAPDCMVHMAMFVLILRWQCFMICFMLPSMTSQKLRRLRSSAIAFAGQWRCAQKP